MCFFLRKTSYADQKNRWNQTQKRRRIKKKKKKKKKVHVAHNVRCELCDKCWNMHMNFFWAKFVVIVIALGFGCSFALFAILEGYFFLASTIIFYYFIVIIECKNLFFFFALSVCRSLPPNRHHSFRWSPEIGFTRGTNKKYIQMQ